MNVTINSSGVLIPNPGTGKDNKFLPWSMVNKVTVAPAIKHCTNEKYGLDMYLVEKTVNGSRLEGVYETKREAFQGGGHSPYQKRQRARVNFKESIIMKNALLIASFVSMTLSLTLWFTGSQMAGLYVGIWCPTLLSLRGFLPRKYKVTQTKYS